MRSLKTSCLWQSCYLEGSSVCRNSSYDNSTFTVRFEIDFKNVQPVKSKPFGTQTKCNVLSNAILM